MKTKTRFISLLAVLLASAPLLSASEVERLRTLVAEQEMQIQQLELKVAQLTNSPTPVTTPATPAVNPKASAPATPEVIPTPPSEDGLVPVAETCPEPSTLQNLDTYTVKAGDNMAIIARKHGTTSATLNKLNGLKSDAIIRPGQKLKLPATAAAPIASTEVAQPSTTAGAPETTLTPTEASSNSVNHTVADKETFYSIAKKYDVSVNALIKENPSINPKTLRIGQIVEIPGQLEAAIPSPISAPEQSLTLTSQRNIPISSHSSTISQPRAADKPVKITKEISYSDFAKNYNTTPARLDQLNGLRLDPTTILAQGSELYIPAQP